MTLTLCTIIASQILDVAGAAENPSSNFEKIEIARADDDGTLARALAGTDLANARRAALALGRTKRPSAAPLLREAMRARDPSLRAIATFGLGLIADPDDLDLIVLSLTKDANGAVRYAAADAVGRIVDAHPNLATFALAQRLVKVTRDDPDATVRSHAAANLDVFSTIGSAASVAREIEAAFGREPIAEVRWHEMWVLYRGYARVADAHFLAAQLSSPDELVRVEALRAVGKRKDAGAAHFVRPLFADPSWRVQLQARETLLALTGQPPTEHLTSFPPGINLPEIPLTLDTSPLIPLAPIPLDRHGKPVPSALPPRPTASPSFQLAAPKLDDLTYGPPLVATTAETLDGPQPGPHPRVRLHTSRGDVVLRLYPEWAPVTVANFLGLTARGYFDGNRWFRVVPDFVHQTGDATGDPDHESGYTIPAEESPVEERTGVVAMGLDYEQGRAVRDSAGTQFYVTDSPQLHLDRAFTVFGEVESGLDVMANLVESDRILEARRLPDD